MSDPSAEPFLKKAPEDPVADTLGVRKAEKDTFNRVIRLSFQIVLLFCITTYMRKTPQRRTQLRGAPWIIASTPFISEIVRQLTSGYRSIHLQKTGEAAAKFLLLGVVVYSLIVWEETLIGSEEEHLFLSGVFLCILSSY